MRFIDDNLLGKLIDWHNETDTVVRVDIDDPFIVEILQNQKIRKRIEKRIEEWNTNEEPELCQCDDCIKIRPHDVELFEKLLRDEE